MSEKHPTWDEIERDRDEPVRLPLDPKAALRGLLAVGPESEIVNASRRDVDAGPAKPHE
jgi:hypothetical protein